MLLLRWFLGAIPRPFSCMPNPRSWWMIRRRRKASSGLVRSTKRWWCHCDRVCANVCRHSNPTTKLCNPFLRMCTKNHQVKRWQCSNIHCVRNGSTSICSWSNSRPWRCDPNQRRRWLDWLGLVRNERMRPNRCVHLLGLCICTQQECSTTWWSCLVIQKRFDGCQQRKQLRERPNDRKKDKKY